MKIKNNTNCPIFQSGLNSKILFQEKLIQPRMCEKYFGEKLGIETQFLQNKSFALASKLCVNILSQVFNRINLPPAIILYNRENIFEQNSSDNFCIPDTKKVLNNDYPFLGRTIFFRQFKNLRTIDNLTEYKYENHLSSSPHFLAPFIHEWLHSIQLDYIYSRFGYGGSCNFLKKIYPNKTNLQNGYKIVESLQTKTLSKEENEIVYDILGKYATLPYNQYLEIFSETFTKFICQVLNGNKIKESPFELIKRTPQEFQDILKKVITFSR